MRLQPTCRPALQVRGVSAVQPGTSAPDEAAARDPHAPPLFSRTGLFEPQPDASYRLHGFKWFTSATDADMTLPLGRVVGRHGSTPP
ncbi:unnamed protein product, partial [Arctogadus glacialis]